MFSLSPFPLAREPTVTAWRGTTLSTRIDKYRPLVMPPRFVRQLRNNTAQSLVLFVKLGVRCGRRLAAPIPSSKSHIPFISALRMGGCVIHIFYAISRAKILQIKGHRTKLCCLQHCNFSWSIISKLKPIMARTRHIKQTILRNCGRSIYPCLN